MKKNPGSSCPGSFDSLVSVVNGNNCLPQDK